MLSAVNATTRQEERVEYASLWQKGAVIACLMALLAVEWTIRKTRNMA